MSISLPLIAVALDGQPDWSASPNKAQLQAGPGTVYFGLGDDPRVLHYIDSLTGQFEPLLGTSVGGGSGPVFPDPVITDTFQSRIDLMTLAKFYTFGSANAGGGSVNIADLTALATYFRPLEDFTGTTSINGEGQRYPGAFNTTNHKFYTDRLSLEASGTVPASRVCQNDSTGPALNGTVFPMARVGLADTTGIENGRLVAVQYKGLYVVGAVTANTSLSLTAVAGNTTVGATGNANNLTVFLPCYYTTAAAQIDYPVGGNGSDMTIQVATLPAGIVPGMVVGAVQGNHAYTRKGEAVVQSVSGTGPYTITLTGESWATQTWPIGTGLIFCPAIRSGQIWSKDTWAIHDRSYNALAMEFDVYIPDTPGGLADFNRVNTLSAYNALDASAPLGWFGAAWWYSADTLAGLTPTGQTEIDVWEGYNSSTMGFRVWTGGNVVKFPPGQGANWFARNTPGDTVTNEGSAGGTVSIEFAKGSGRSMNGNHKLQILWMPGATYRWLDGVMMKADMFHWLSTNPFQIGVDLAVGSMDTNYAANLMYPINGSLANMQFGIRSLKVWTI